jgi:hypothetical protein
MTRHVSAAGPVFFIRTREPELQGRRHPRRYQSRQALSADGGDAGWCGVAPNIDAGGKVGAG